MSLLSDAEQPCGEGARPPLAGTNRCDCSIRALFALGNSDPAPPQSQPAPLASATSAAAQDKTSRAPTLSALRLPPMHHMQRHIRMHALIHDRLAHLDQKHLNLQLRPPERHQRPPAQPAQAVHDDGAQEQPAAPQPLVARPHAQRALVRRLAHVGEARRGQLVREGVHCVHVGAERAHAGGHVGEVVAQCVRGGGGEGVVVGLGDEGDFLDFEVAAGFEVACGCVSGKVKEEGRRRQLRTGGPGGRGLGCLGRSAGCGGGG